MDTEELAVIIVRGLDVEDKVVGKDIWVAKELEVIIDVDVVLQHVVVYEKDVIFLFDANIVNSSIAIIIAIKIFETLKTYTSFVVDVAVMELVEHTNDADLGCNTAFS